MTTRTSRSGSAAPEGRARLLAGVAVAAAAGFARLALAVAHRDTAPADEAVHDATALPEDHPVREAAAAIAPAGKKKMYLPAALALSACILAAPGARAPGALRSRAAGAAAVVAAAGMARGLNPAFDRWLPQPPPPPGHPPDRPVFPSGHALGPGAVALAVAYVAAREGVAPAAAAFPAALAVPLVLSGARVVEEKHWITDMIGGYLGAAALASTTLAAYERARG
jgi:membrane-associated phospholipid phosphatase